MARNVVIVSWITTLLSMIYFSTAAAAAVDNVVGIAHTGSPVTNRGLDDDGYAYAATLLGTSLSWAGSTFTLGAAGIPDAASSATITLPAGRGSTMNLLATAVNGDQPSQTFIVTYTDGSSTSFTRSLSDWCTPQNYAGESQVLKMAYRIAPSGATSNGPIYLYGYSFALNSAKTVKSITLPDNRNVVVLAVDVSPIAVSPTGTDPPTGTAVPPSLSQADNVVGIVAEGSPVTHGGLDDDGYAYSASSLGTSFSWEGSTFKLGAAGTYDAASSTTIALPAGNGSTVNILATAVNGNQPNQTFVVTYTDGTTASFTQSLSDWYTPQKYAGETKVSEMAYRIAPSGATDNSTFYLYGYSFALNSAKTVQSLTLPHNRNVVVLAVAVSKAGNVPLTAAAPSLSPAPGTYTSAQSVTLSDSTPGAAIYYTTNGTTPTTSSAQYRAGTPLHVSSTTTIKAIAAASNYSNSAVIGANYTITSTTTVPPSAKTLKISGTPETTAEVGKFYSFTPTIVASAGSSLTFKVANMPAWAQFSAAKGTLSGTPTAGSAATDANILISVSNGATSVSLPAFDIAVAPAAAAAPSVSLSASPSNVASGGSSRLTWSTTNASSCTASGAWSSTKATSGSSSTGSISSTSTYTLTCSGAGGSAVSKATVTVAASAASTISFNGQWWANNSVWNTPIPAGAFNSPHANSAAVMNAYMAYGGNINHAFNTTKDTWTAAIIDAPTGTATMSYTYTYAGSGSWTFPEIPLTGSVLTAVHNALTYFANNGDTDRAVVIFSEDQQVFYNLYPSTASGNTPISIITGAVFQINGPGWWDNYPLGNTLSAGSAAGASYAGGMIRPSEWAAGVINHALAGAWPGPLVGGSYIYPAMTSDGYLQGAQYLPEGARLQLDPSLTDAQLQALGVTTEMLPVCHALQIYGWYNMDQQADFPTQIKFQSALGNSATVYPGATSLPMALMNHIHWIAAPSSTAAPPLDNPGSAAPYLVAH